MTELKPCPFCSSLDIEITINEEYYNGYISQCNNCSAESSQCDTKDEAITAWNTRAKSPEYEKLLAFTKEIAKDNVNAENHILSEKLIIYLHSIAKLLLKDICEKDEI